MEVFDITSQYTFEDESQFILDGILYQKGEQFDKKNCQRGDVKFTYYHFFPFYDAMLIKTNTIKKITALEYYTKLKEFKDSYDAEDFLASILEDKDKFWFLSVIVRSELM